MTMTIQLRYNKCINYATKICEHVLAVAQLRGTLDEFVAWFKQKKNKLVMMEMAEERGPKNVGRKPSKRKRSNSKGQVVKEYVDLLGDNDTGTSSHSMQPATYTSAATNKQPHRATFQQSISSASSLGESQTSPKSSMHAFNLM